MGYESDALDAVDAVLMPTAYRSRPHTPGSPPNKPESHADKYSACEQDSSPRT
jgi:hypothetical protein